ncbi:uncharacterized protein TNCV_3183691 [Trichonephila clavipes]|uniref:Mutator-like transposase domain-containing protein n=1 Tax=Trichonephila clavipes TaxID=2585209 RepID=A0A8X6SE50_TRICX|nr:uncharacterized protein TNCV_3183691 [Trichonephila clavipes]
MKVKPSKCKFAQQEALFLSHTVNSGSRSPSDMKIKVIQDFPPPTTRPNNQERKLLKVTESVAQENINATLGEIKGSNNFAKWGISIDGTLQRRCYSPLNGCVSAISVDTGKSLDIEVMTQYCQICAKGNSQVSKHACSNYKGSAGNMEVIRAYRTFEGSNHPLREGNVPDGGKERREGRNIRTKQNPLGPQERQKRIGRAVITLTPGNLLMLERLRIFLQS